MSTDSQKTPLDALAPDYDRHPKFGKATCADVTVGAGEMVYYPSFWWHQTQVRLLLVARRSVQMLVMVEAVLSGVLCVVAVLGHADGERERPPPRRRNRAPPRHPQTHTSPTGHAHLICT